MKKIILLFTVLTFLLSILNLYAQSPPKFDKNWQLDPSLSDEFDSFNNTKWLKLTCSTGNCYGDGPMDQSYATIQSGYLKLRIDNLNGILTTAGIRSKNYNYSYGYLEIKAKLPGFNNNGQSCGEGLMPCFWTYYQDSLNTAYDCNPDPNVVQHPLFTHREIDILESSGETYADAKGVGCGWWTNQRTNLCAEKYGSYIYHSSTPLYSADHKFAIEWLPNRLIFYFDDKAFISHYSSLVPDKSHKIVIDQQLRGQINGNTPLPLFMEVDYFKYWILKMDCSNDAVIENNSQLNSFQFAVKRNITIGRTDYSNISLSSGDNMTFRATNNITIYGIFSVPLGAEFNIIPTPCF